jgi:hypothetical protein
MKQIKTIKGLALELCRREKKKKQVDIAQMSEVLGVISDMVYMSKIDDFWSLFYDNGLKRAKKKAKSCKK